MKFFLFVLLFNNFPYLRKSSKESPNDLTKEIISVVYMSVNNKSKSQIDDFSEYYQEQMKALEPNVLSRFFKSGVATKSH